MVTTRRRALAVVSGNSRPTKLVAQKTTYILADDTDDDDAPLVKRCCKGNDVLEIPDSDAGSDDDFDNLDTEIEDLLEDEDENKAEENGTDDEDLISHVPTNLNRFLPNGPVIIVKTDVERFQSRLGGMVTYLCNHVKDESTHDPINTAEWRIEISRFFITYLQSASPEEITERMLAGIPNVTRTILGRQNLQPSDLLGLPTIDYDFRLWGVYINITTEANKPSGMYVGVSTASEMGKGIVGRVEGHLRETEYHRQGRGSKKQGKLYKQWAKEGVASNFRALALAPIGHDRVSVLFTEAMLMAYVGIPLQARNPAARLMAKMLQEHPTAVLTDQFPDTPDFSGYALNAIWAIQQTPFGSEQRRDHAKWALTHPDVCRACGDPRPPPLLDGKWIGFKEHSRCSKCYNHWNLHGVERPTDIIPASIRIALETKAAHDEWAKTHDDVCGHCGILRLDGGRFYLTQGESRCNNCYQYRKVNGVERPLDRITYATHVAWVAEGNDDVCISCKEPRPQDGNKSHWVGFMEESRCKSCSDYRNRYGEDRGPAPKIRQTKQAHEAFLETGGFDGCQNCYRPRGEFKIKGRGDMARCEACYRWKRRHDGVERPLDEE